MRCQVPPSVARPRRPAIGSPDWVVTWFFATGVLLLIGGHPTVKGGEGAPAELAAALETLLAVGERGEGHQAAARAWRPVAQADPSQLPLILGALDRAGPLAANWIRAAGDAVAERCWTSTGTLPVEALEAFVVDRSHAPRGRRMAYEWLRRADPAAEARLIPTMLDDPSLELRYDAVARLVAAAQDELRAGRQQEAVATLRQALAAARELAQVNQIRELLDKQGIKIDLAGHFGFLRQWKLIGPFDNTDMSGFEVVYPPERELDLAASYPGKGQTAAWIEHTTAHEMGMVDLNEALGKHKGAVAYAWCEFVSPRAQDAELRLGCINAPKLWLNGELLFERHVYHAGSEMDQYIARGRLRSGKNQILLKICQNEQTEDWAQTWEFQLRVCDAVGTPLEPAGAAAAAAPGGVPAGTAQADTGPTDGRQSVR